jgi:hypothetical protein
VKIPLLQETIRAVTSGRAAFIPGDERMSEWLGRTSDNHNEGFLFPGSQGSSGAWVIGRGESFTLGEKPRNRAGAIDLLVYLTSKGVAQEFARALPGHYYSWEEKPKPDKLPEVHGPELFLAPDEADR